MATIAWLGVHMIDKSIWSIFVMLQFQYFAQWSTKMNTRSEEWNALLYILMIPILMNAIMFWMFSQISRLKLACFKVEYRKKLDACKEI